MRLERQVEQLLRHRVRVQQPAGAIDRDHAAVDVPEDVLRPEAHLLEARSQQRRSLGAFPQSFTERRSAQRHDGKECELHVEPGVLGQVPLENRDVREVEDDAQRRDEQAAALRQQQGGHRQDEDVQRREGGRPADAGRSRRVHHDGHEQQVPDELQVEKRPGERPAIDGAVAGRHHGDYRPQGEGQCQQEGGPRIDLEPAQQGRDEQRASDRHPTDIDPPQQAAGIHDRLEGFFGGGGSAHRPFGIAKCESQALQTGSQSASTSRTI